MLLFQQIQNKIKINQNELSGIQVNGVTPEQWFFITRQLWQQVPKLKVFIFPKERLASTHASADPNGVFYPGLNHSPYSSTISSEYDLMRRIQALNKAYSFTNSNNSESKSLNIYCSYQAAFLKFLGRDFFQSGNDFKIVKEDIISPKDLSEKLTSLGYQFRSQIQEPGDFSRRGEIFDLYTFSGEAVRFHYFDDLIEEIFPIALETQRTLRDKPLEEIVIDKANQVLSQEAFVRNFKENFPRPQLKYSNLVEWRKDIFSKLSRQNLFPNYSLYAHLFTKSSSTLFEHLKNKAEFVIFDEHKSLIIKEELLEDLKSQFENNINDLETSIPNLAPESFYQFTPSENIKVLRVNEYSLDVFEKDLESLINIQTQSSVSLYKGAHQYLTFNEPKNRFQFLKNVTDLIKRNFSYKGEIYLLFKYVFSEEEIKEKLIQNGVHPEVFERIHIIDNFQCDGFYHQEQNLLVISERDWGVKKLGQSSNNNSSNKASSVQASQLVSADFFAEQISHLKTGDHIIHADYGVGIYKGLEKLQLTGNESDFMVIDYADGDKVYVPVYKINLVQKHSDSEIATKLDSLRSKKFLNARNKAKKAAKQLAFDLLELQAKRKLEKGFAYSISGEDFIKFEFEFPYDETPDQKNAIEKVISDMESDNPMDRLVCGDVGFGKTEVAMRAAMKAVLDSKQVAVLVPTTILSLQHFNSFKQRFKNFPIEIEFLSRLKTAKQAREIMEKLSEGKIDIVIGTHRLLSTDIKYKDLGLVIVDEEHRFGVAHKEKLKLLKASVDMLTMTATPIPRTMQLAQMGLRDISIIQTPPPRRQAVKTFLIRDDQATIQEAINRELKRGGQIYYIHNRVQDIELVHRNLQLMAPDAKIVIAHGQMNERDLEKRIQKFYDGEAQILLATTIVESGIDVPMANTMIVSRADRFGLAQLHQLRGRIGRSDRKAYAYLMIPRNKTLNDTAGKRLKALQTFSEMGAGFSISSTDLDIRGAGNILGGEQSGHITSIGLELYLELLQEAVAEMKGKKEVSIQQIEVQTHFPSYIPSSDIEDHGLRLRYYKRLSRCQSVDALNDILHEMIDLYGQISQETKNLFSVFEIRLLAKKLFLNSVKTSKFKVILKFDEKMLENTPAVRNKLIEHFLSRPRTFKVKPDFSVNCTLADAVDRHILTQFVSSLVELIVELP